MFLLYLLFHYCFSIAQVKKKKRNTFLRLFREMKLKISIFIQVLALYRLFFFKNETGDDVNLVKKIGTQSKTFPQNKRDRPSILFLCLDHGSNKYNNFRKADDGKFVCLICNRSLSSKHRILLHLHTVHKMSKTFSLFTTPSWIQGQIM